MEITPECGGYERKRGVRAWPTLSRELMRARATMEVTDAVSLAVRRDRARLVMSQRAYADHRGWSKTYAARIEARPEEFRLGQAVAALRGTGFRLALVADPDDGGGSGLDPPPVDPQSWTAAELIGRDLGGRRLPAHARVSRSTEPAMWFYVRQGTWFPTRLPNWDWHHRR
ncbi:MAG: hypothetical protein LWW86_06815 [Micrococcales bacterium]|nr:hypothetical protein [Micrococcales bacterium]